MSFTPVSLIGPDGSEYNALDAVQLNNLMARGYQRVEVADLTVNTSAPSPVPRSSYSTVGDYVAAQDYDEY